MNKNDLHAGHLEINKGPLCFWKTQSTRTLVYSGVESITVICHPPEQNKAMWPRECADNLTKCTKGLVLLCANSSREPFVRHTHSTLSVGNKTYASLAGAEVKSSLPLNPGANSITEVSQPHSLASLFSLHHLHIIRFIAILSIKKDSYIFWIYPQSCIQ